MARWSCTVILEGDPGVDALEELFDLVFGLGIGAVGSGPAEGPPTFGATFDVDTDNAPDAVREALEVFTQACATCGLTSGPVAEGAGDDRRLSGTLARRRSPLGGTPRV